MMRSFFTIMLAIIAGGAQAQSPAGDEVINWSPDRKLTWADYKGAAKLDTDVAASTATYLGIEYNFSSKGFDYKITCTFSKNKSWGLHKTDYILSHEQGHFDIAEIFARKLNKQMSEYNFNKDSFKEDLKKIYLNVTVEKEQMQNEYDRETDHSIIKRKQEEWLKKIDTMLVELKNFSNYRR